MLLVLSSLSVTSSTILQSLLIAEASTSAAYYLDETINIIGPTRLHFRENESAPFEPQEGEGAMIEYQRLTREYQKMKIKLGIFDAALVTAKGNERERIGEMRTLIYEKMPLNRARRRQLKSETNYWAAKPKVPTGGYAAVYVIVGDEIKLLSGQDQQEFHEFWFQFKTLIPLERRILIKTLHFFEGNGETGGHLAYAAPISGQNLNDWLLAFNADFARQHSDIRPDSPYAIIHEWSHQFSLGVSQVHKSGTIEHCPEDHLELNIGCTRKHSYINRFYQEFWTDIIDQFNQEDPLSVKTFYQENKDQFVTEYAATSPEEDFAETFTFFILGDPPAGETIADQKLMFMYNKSTWVKFRDEVRSKLSLP